MNPKKKILLQQKLIQSLTSENEKLKNELTYEKAIPNEGYAKAQKLIEELENKITQYNHLIEEVLSLKNDYNKKLSQMLDAKKEFKKTAGKTVNLIRKGIR